MLAAGAPSACGAQSNHCNASLIDDRGLGVCGTAIAQSPLHAGGLSVEAICHVAATCVIIGACVRNVPQLVACWRQKRCAAAY